MYSDNPEAFAIAVLYLAGCLPALFVFWNRRDPFDPRVFFPIFYVYVTSGACLFKIFCSGQYHPGLKTDLLIPVLFSCCTAVVGFIIGGSLALRGRGRRIRNRRIVHNVATYRERIANSLVRNVSVFASAVAISIYAYISYQVQLDQAGSGGGSKVDYLVNADETTLRLFYFFAAASTAALTLAVITDAYVSKKAFSFAIVILLLAEFMVCTFSGERDILLVGGVWCTANWPKLSRTQLLLMAVGFVGWLGLSPVLRTAGLGLGNQIGAIQEIHWEDWFYSITHFAPNVHVYTNVATEVPAVDSYWHGYSLLGAVVSFCPGSFALKDITPALWFRDVYDMQRASGFAFSQEAEAYLNFGWVGPPIWFGVWGYLLAVAYRRAKRPSAQLWDVFIWWYAVSVSLFGVRADSRGIIKMFVLGAVASKLLCVFASAWASRRSRELPRQPRKFSVANQN